MEQSSENPTPTAGEDTPEVAETPTTAASQDMPEVAETTRAIVESAPPLPVATESATEFFKLQQRQAIALAASNAIPPDYSGNVPNCLVAVQVAYNTRIHPLVVVQNLHIIHKRPVWSSSFIIAAINACGKFSPLRYELTGSVVNGDLACTAWAYDKAYGEKLYGPTVTLDMANREGWTSRKGSKWQNMPELMIRYRAAAFFGRLYAPDLLMGMHAADEVEDFAPQDNSATQLKADFS